MSSPSVRRVWKPWKSKKVLVGLLALVVFLAVEVTVHHLPPDSVTITTVTAGAWPNDPSGATVTKSVRYSGAQGQAVLRQLTHVFATAPRTSSQTYFTVQTICGPLAYMNYTVTFTWHGLTVQSWADIGGCPDYLESSGGLPNVLSARTLTAADQMTLATLGPPYADPFPTQP